MALDVSRALMYPGQSYPFEEAVTLPTMEILDDMVSFEEVRLAGTFTGAEKIVGFSGTLVATVHAHCGRCVSDVARSVRLPFDEAFAKTPDPDDPDLYPLDGHTEDLTDLAKDVLLLDLPMRFLCSQACKGLCPVCGVNRNIQRCTCQEGGTKLPNPFSALSEMLTKDEEV